MELIRVVIVDDEPLARENLEGLLTSDSEIEIVGQCANGVEAIRTIKKIKPDILFLDVEMPEMNGFEVLSKIPTEYMPIVVFVTAYNKYALKAFEVNALDYLLKPFDNERFSSMIERVKLQFRQHLMLEYGEKIQKLMSGEFAFLTRRDSKQQHEKSSFLKRIAVKTSGRIYFVDVNQIQWIEAARSYVELHTQTKTHLVRETMNNLEANLDPEQFLRIHRSTLINISFIKELQPFFRGDYLVILKNGKELKLTRGNRDKLDFLLNRIPKQDS